MTEGFLVQNPKTGATDDPCLRTRRRRRQRMYGYCTGCVNSSCRPCVCFPGVLEDVRDVSAILTRDVMRLTCHSGARGGVGEDTSRDVTRGRA